MSAQENEQQTHRQPQQRKQPARTHRRPRAKPMAGGNSLHPLALAEAAGLELVGSESVKVVAQVTPSGPTCPGSHAGSPSLLPPETGWFRPAEKFPRFVAGPVAQQARRPPASENPARQGHRRPSVMQPVRTVPRSAVAAPASVALVPRRGQGTSRPALIEGRNRKGDAESQRWRQLLLDLDLIDDVVVGSGRGPGYAQPGIVVHLGLKRTDTPTS